MLTTILGYILGGLGLGSLIIFFVSRHDTKKGLEKATKENTEDIKKIYDVMEIIKDMAMASLYDRTKYWAECYIKRGYITSDEYDDWVKYLYKPYKAGEGDGTIDRLKMEVDRLRFETK